jgi:hypothetical protein
MELELESLVPKKLLVTATEARRLYLYLTSCSIILTVSLCRTFALICLLRQEPSILSDQMVPLARLAIDISRSIKLLEMMLIISL